MTENYLPRLADERIHSILKELPAVLIVGPRASGKTTSARRFAASVVRLDREAEAAAFRADPDVALRGLPEPVLLDEWQAVPQVLGAVKRAVDDDASAGRFLLTGSVRADLEAQTWPGTGRVVRVQMLGLTTREMNGGAAQASIVDRIFAGGVDSIGPPSTDVPDLRGYLEMALASAFPEPALRLSPEGRIAWLDGYLDQLLTRDASDITERDPAKIRRYFEGIAATTAGTPRDRKLYEAAAINAKTASGYDRLLRNLFVLDAIPAWTPNRLKRLTKSPKRYVVDAALAASALRLDVAGAMRDGDIMGRFLDTFVATQLRAEVAASRGRPRLYHLRTESGRHEIDLLVEYADGRVLAMEVKADAAPDSSAARHLAWLRDHLGDRFLGAVVWHTGPRSFQLGERIMAHPISALWGT